MSTEAAVTHLQLVSIGKRYSGTKALDNVSVEVAGGTVHALVGANGAGKSTLGKIIGGVTRPDDGEMFIDDRPVRFRDPHEARNDGIATISQELSPMPHMSVIENVFFGIEPRRADVQKVEILRAVATDAQVIVMDEPTSSLTSVETSTLHRMIRALRERGK